MGGKNKIGRVASPEIIFIHHLKWVILFVNFGQVNVFCQGTDYKTEGKMLQNSDLSHHCFLRHFLPYYLTFQKPTKQTTKIESANFFYKKFCSSLVISFQRKKSKNHRCWIYGVCKFNYFF